MSNWDEMNHMRYASARPKNTKKHWYIHAYGKIELCSLAFRLAYGGKRQFEMRQ